MQQAKTYAQSCGLLYTETSAKTGVNVHKMFQVIGKWKRVCIYFAQLVTTYLVIAFLAFLTG